jgi:hypothetical protein
MREVIFKMMGATKHDRLPAPIPGAFWIENPKVRGEFLLRPDFSKSWSANKDWHNDAWERLKKDGAGLVEAAADSIAKLDKATFKSKMSASVFKGFKQRYKREEQSGEERIVDAKTQRQESRKRRVS